jgi:hypothetical protein
MPQEKLDIYENVYIILIEEFSDRVNILGLIEENSELKTLQK